MKAKQIKALKIEPCKQPYLCMLYDKLEELQKAVSIGADKTGLIELVTLDKRIGNLKKNVFLLCNEEGKLLSLTPNRRVGKDIICGTFYIIGQGKNGSLESIPDDAIKFYTEYFKNTEPVTIDNMDNYLRIEFKTM